MGYKEPPHSEAGIIYMPYIGAIFTELGPPTQPNYPNDDVPSDDYYADIEEEEDNF